MVGALALVVGVTVAPPGPAAEGTAVQMVDNEPDLTNWHFDPAEMIVPVGATVAWHNRGHEDHSVTADDGSFDSGLKKPGTDFQRAFAKAGKYAYHCQPHPWMKGVIRVGAVAAAGATATTATAAPATTTTTRAGPAPTRAGSATTTFPPSLAAPPAPSGSQTTATTQAPASPASTPAAASGGSAAPAGKASHSGAGLLGTLAVVLIPTLGALLVAARLRRARS
jgi:plastocyanin